MIVILDREGPMTHYGKRITRSLRDGWTKSYLIFTACVLLPLVAGAETTTISEPEKPDYLIDDRVFPYIFALILAHALVPLIKYAWSTRVSRKAYRAFLVSNINSAKIRFGAEKTIAEVRDKCPAVIAEDGKWLEYLEKYDANVPKVFIVMAQAIGKRFSGNPEDEKYVPFLTYNGMPTSELDHEHPIWLFSRKDNAVISKYLLSERQVEQSIKDLYERPLVSLAASKKPPDRARWSGAALSLLKELAEHYVNLLELERHLTGTNTPYTFDEDEEEEKERREKEGIDPSVVSEEGVVSKKVEN